MTSSAVATGRESFTVLTPTVSRTRRIVDDYLDGTRADVVAVVGPPGTGKTHLAWDIARHVGPRTGPAVTPAVIEAGDGFADLYRRLVERLGVAAVTSRVDHWYTRMVLDELAGSALGQDITRRVATKELTVAEAVQRGASLIADVLSQFERTLAARLDAKKFSAALSLLMRNGYAHAVWEWLLGEQPHELLRERNLSQLATDEQSALTALSVLARLLGHPFVLVIDDAERLFVRDQDADILMEHFRKFLETCVDSGVLLVLVGHPSFLSSLSDVAMARIGTVLRTTSFSAEHAEEYIRLSRRSAAVTPFTQDLVQYLVDLTDGEPRGIVRLCAALHATATNGVELSRSTVRDAMDQQLSYVDAEDVHREVRRVLDSFEVSYSRGHEHVQYLLSPGVAVVLSGSVLSTAEADSLTATLDLAKTGSGAAELILIVIGHLPGAWMRSLERTTGCTALVYHRATFAEDFGQVLRSRLRAARHLAADDLGASLNRIAGSLRTISSRLDVIESRLDGMSRGG